MFDIMDEKLNEKGKKKKLVKEMKESAPKVYQALHPPLDFVAAETRAELKYSKDQLLKMFLDHPERIKQNRELFQSILGKYREISKKISKLL